MSAKVDEAEVLAAIEHDDGYRLVRVLADKPTGSTELVVGEGEGLLVRKRIPREVANEEAWQVVRTANHPLLPHVLDLYWLPDQLVVITSYVEGFTLGELVDAAGPLAPSEAARYLHDLCEAVAVLHAHGIVHRDITPGNAVVRRGTARIIDLGNARAYVQGANRDTTRLGTWGYAAPEQYGFAQTDARSDVYGLGSLLGFLLTGLHPGDEGFDHALAGEHVPGGPVPLAPIPEALADVVRTARAFEPSARYQSVAALDEAARHAASTAEPSDPPQSVVAPIPVPEKTERAATEPAQAKASADSQQKGTAPQEQKADKTQARQRSILPPASERRDPFRTLQGIASRIWEQYTQSWLHFGFGYKMGTVTRWLIAITFVAGFLKSGFTPASYTKPYYNVYLPAAGITSAICTILCGHELQRAAMWRALGHELARIPTTCKTVGKWVAIGFAVVCAFAVVTAILSSF